MKVLLIKPMQHPKIVDIEPGLESLQKAVGGYIEAVYPFDDPVAIICDEEGKLKGKEFNRELRNEDGEIYDIIAGDFLVVGLGEEDFTDLSHELAMKYLELFWAKKQFLFDEHRNVTVIYGPDYKGERNAKND